MLEAFQKLKQMLKMKFALTLINEILWKYKKQNFGFSSSLGQKCSHWNHPERHLKNCEIRLCTITPQGNIIKTKINFQPVRFRWVVCAKHKHRCFPESLPESRRPRLRKIKFSYHHRQNTDKEPTVYSCKQNIIYLR